MSAAEGDSPLFSPYWYKMAGLAPRLRPGVTVARRLEQGEVWHILSAPEANKHFRLDAASYAIIGACDGRQTLDAIWRRVLDRFGDDAPGQDETIRLLGQLHQADALNSGAAPTLTEFGHRARRVSRQKMLQRLKSPLFIKVPLFDPNALIQATYPFVRPVFSVPGFLLWLACVTWLAVETLANWDRLSGAVLDRALALDNLLIAALVFPFAKALHEMAHGWAVRHWGGEVREFGIMFLVFLPAPYVDASAAAAFRSRGARILVGGAGMMAETLLAAGAMYVWLGAETGMVSALAFNMLLIAGVSTLLFNGNPLLRFDAYFMLSDAIGVQNLAGRSQAWWSAMLHRLGFGLTNWDSPARSRTETAWFIPYHPASYAYRIFLTMTIALFVASEYRVIGLALALWSVATTIVLPLVKGVWHVATEPRVASRRGRAVLVSALIGGLPAAALLLIPVPHGTVAPGVVTAPDAARVSAPVEAEILHIRAQAGDHVEPGQALADLVAPLATTELEVIDARIATARARLADYEVRSTGMDEAAATRAEIGYLIEEQAGLGVDLAGLALSAGASGQFLARSDILVPGRRLAKGMEVGILVPEDSPAQIRVAVPANRIDLVALSPAEVSVHLPGRGFDGRVGHLRTIAPEATRRLEFPALSQPAGGPLVLDPSDEDGRRTAQPFHLAEIDGGVTYGETAIGALVWVRFDHGRSPLAPRLWRMIRQTFLERLAL
ncbi:PqqD family peptide modification chaperone [Roseisalinus antarcticus]|uniref:Peptidase family M50 n=1 Tax=Roseisalinus antarcticus TaxID=254357 RepID=A0A1Y5TLL2_9RHOB|nr:PqqD family peptide modification chaperone [Roseisalinus antarcticus]SLN63090.1 hypothetical protein ROA7023_02953 [Roseisalinus antarcticus]